MTKQLQLQLQPANRFHFWRREGRLWYAALSDLNKAIFSSGQSIFELRRKLGDAFESLIRAKAGEGISDSAVAFIEYALSPRSEELTLVEFFPPSSCWRRYGKAS